MTASLKQSNDFFILTTVYRNHPGIHRYISITKVCKVHLSVCIQISNLTSLIPCSSKAFLKFSFNFAAPGQILHPPRKQELENSGHTIESIIIFYRHKVFYSWNHSTNVILFIKSVYKSFDFQG